MVAAAGDLCICQQNTIAILNAGMRASTKITCLPKMILLYLKLQH
jgi:hypothetical protein